MLNYKSLQPLQEVGQTDWEWDPLVVYKIIRFYIFAPYNTDFPNYKRLYPSMVNVALL